MTIAAKHSIAFRLGRVMGAMARFGMHDRNPTLRWVKRVFFATFIVLVLATSISWILSALLTAIFLVLVLYAFSRVKPDNAELFAEDKEAPFGRDGVMGCPLTIWGERTDGLDRDLP
ncbi:hypothetical protein ACK2SD_06960 [Pseudomonas sp. SC11]|uniref:hypothetical protein n=1 Tax=Pseudomonas sp. SC11 TaxID=326927 RepID=UPI00399ABD5C